MNELSEGEERRGRRPGPLSHSAPDRTVSYRKGTCLIAHFGVLRECFSACVSARLCPAR